MAGALNATFFSLFSLVPPTFNRAGGVVASTSSPGVRGDVRDVVLNNPISLYCETNAVPPPTLTWYKDGQLLASNDKVLILPGNSCKETVITTMPCSHKYGLSPPVSSRGKEKLLLTLTVLFPGGRVLQIPRAQAEDSGRYICLAVNEAGEDSIHYDVRVLCE